MSRVADNDLDDRLSFALRAHGQRVTLPRLLVHRHVCRADQHLTAEQLHSELVVDLPSLSPATIYATLEVLEDLRLVRRVSTPGGATVYDSRTDHHHHAVCRSCGAIADVDADVPTEVVTAIAGRTGFLVEHAEVQLTGLCPDCAQRSA